MTFLRHAMAFSGPHGMDLVSLSQTGRRLARRSRTARCASTTGNGSSSSSSVTDHHVVPIIPRAAVSVCVRCRDHYLLVQRGTAPNLGMWSFPGGKLEYAETSVEGARRELHEETTGWPPHHPLQWHPKTFATTDSFGEGYHYVIVHCYAELVVPNANNDPLPVIAPADDAADAKWFRKANIHAMEESNTATIGLRSVIERAEALHRADLLETSSRTNEPT
jgi:8-oxo-dGTP diphosphatase